MSRRPSHSKAGRNAKLCAEYLAGDTYEVLARRYGITMSRVCRIVHRAKVNQPIAMRMMGRDYASPGRPPYWPDCPAEVRDRYEILKRKIGAERARKKVEGELRLRRLIAKFGPVTGIAA